MKQRHGDERTGPGDDRSRPAGFSLVEILMAIVVLAIATGIGVMGMRGFNESSVVDRAATSVASDVTLTRSYAVQRRTEVVMAADEADRSYAIREVNTGGADDTLLVRSYSADSDLPLTRLDIQTGSDELAFNARGLLVSGSNVTILVERLDAGKEITVTALGRTHATAAP